VRVPSTSVSRRRLVWLLIVPLAAFGSQLAHALAYRLVTPDEVERAHELAVTGHAYLAHAPAALAVCSVLVLLALGAELRQLARGRTQAIQRPSAVAFAALAPSIYVCQEHFERLFHDGTFPWDTAVQPAFVVGLLLQLPFAGAAYVLARVLLRAVRALGGLLIRRPRRRARAWAPRRPAIRFLRPRLPALALGYGSRGPPAPPR
jgi:hypothetical protein